MLLKIMWLTSMEQAPHVNACIHYHRVEEDVAYHQRWLKKLWKIGCLIWLDQVNDIIRHSQLEVIMYERIILRATSHMRLRAPLPIHFKHSHWWKRRSRSRFTSLCWRDQHSMWMQDGCKVYMDFYMASNEPCLMSFRLFSKTTFWR